jgi:hypothetical protein
MSEVLCVAAARGERIRNVLASMGRRFSRSGEVRRMKRRAERAITRRPVPSGLLPHRDSHAKSHEIWVNEELISSNIYCKNIFGQGNYDHLSSKDWYTYIPFRAHRHNQVRRFSPWDHGCLVRRRMGRSSPRKTRRCEGRRAVLYLRVGSFWTRRTFALTCFTFLQSAWIGIIHSADTLYQIRDDLHASPSFEIRGGHPRVSGTRIHRPWFFQRDHRS